MNLIDLYFFTLPFFTLLNDNYIFPLTFYISILFGLKIGFLKTKTYPKILISSTLLYIHLAVLDETWFVQSGL